MENIDFGKTVNLILIPASEAKTISVTSIQHPIWIDNGLSVKAIIAEIINPITKTIVLWDNTTPVTYDQIGNWTEDQAIARLKEIFNY